MSDQTRRLHAIVESLESRGVDVGELHALEEELAQIEEPPGLFHRVSRQVSAFAARQWGHLMGELQESQQAFGLLTRRLGGEDLSAEEQAVVRAHPVAEPLLAALGYDPTPADPPASPDDPIAELTRRVRRSNPDPRDIAALLAHPSAKESHLAALNARDRCDEEVLAGLAGWLTHHGLPSSIAATLLGGT